MDIKAFFEKDNLKRNLPRIIPVVVLLILLAFIAANSCNNHDQNDEGDSGQQGGKDDTTSTILPPPPPPNPNPNIDFFINKQTVPAGEVYPTIVGTLVEFEDYSNLEGLSADQWQWDFNNDQLPDSFEKKAEHTFDTPGRYPVRLTIIDNKGFKHFNEKEVEVKDVETVANFSVSGDGIPNSRMTFTGSSIPSNRINTRSWAFRKCDDPSSNYRSLGSGKLAYNTFTGIGTYCIRLCINGGQDPDDCIEKKVTIGYPKIRVNFDLPKDPLSREDLAFKDRSTPSNLIQKREWDFDGDGTIDSRHRNPSFSYNKADTYTVKLTITDKFGKIHQGEKKITVGKPGEIPPFRCVAGSKTNEFGVEISKMKECQSDAYATSQSTITIIPKKRMQLQEAHVMANDNGQVEIEMSWEDAGGDLREINLQPRVNAYNQDDENDVGSQFFLTKLSLEPDIEYTLRIRPKGSNLKLMNYTCIDDRSLSNAQFKKFDYSGNIYLFGLQFCYEK